MRKKIYSSPIKVRFCKVYINSVKNNTFATVHLIQSDVRRHFSSGKLGAKGSKKKTSYATQQIIRAIIKTLKEENAQQVILYISSYKRKLPGALGILLTYLTRNRIQLLRIQSIQPVTYNGTRPPKIRRV